MTDLTQPRAAFDILANRLNDAGIPVESVSGNVGAVEVTYAPFATQAQRDQGAAIVAAFDWALTAERAAEAAANTNGRTLEDQAIAALAANKVFYQRTSSTTAQVLAQVKALSRQNNALIRLLLRRLDGVD